MKDYLWLSFILLPVGIWMYFDGSSSVALHEEINKNGVETTGYPTYIEYKKSRRSSSYYCTVEYLVDGVVKEYKKFPISGKLYHEIEINDKAKRDTVLKIKYLKSDHTKFIILGDSSDHAFNMYFGLAMGVAGLLGSLYWLFTFVSSKTKMADA